LGHIVFGYGVVIDKNKVDAIMRWHGQWQSHVGAGGGHGPPTFLTFFLKFYVFKNLKIIYF